MATPTPQTRPRAIESPRLVAVPGAVHVHTTYSDGSGDFAEIAAAAAATGLKFVVTTDHNTLAPIRDGHERYWGDLLVLAGTEISTDGGHYLAFDVPASFEWPGRDPQAVVDAVNAAGGFGVIAHPQSPRSPWTRWDVEGHSGVEIVNLVSLAERHVRQDPLLPIGRRCLIRMLRLFWMYARDPDRVTRLLAPTGTEAERGHWDTMLAANSPALGLGGVDAHARIKVSGMKLRMPAYAVLFRSLQTYALLSAPLSGDFRFDRDRVYRAMRTGQIYTVFPDVGPAGGFRFYASDHTGMGGSTPMRPGLELNVDVPGRDDSIVRLIRNGETLWQGETDRLTWRVDQPGAYRVEAGVPVSPIRSGTVEFQPWIYSNPIRVTGQVV